MGSFWRIANKVIDKADILLIVADARFPEESMNQEILDKVKKKGKKAIIVFNKSDLITRFDEKLILTRYKNAVTLSAVEHRGNMRLLRKINETARGEEAVVGVLGYPNTGKSSVINSIKGRQSAPVSSSSGFTKGVQMVRVTKKVMLIDTPGVISYKEKDESLHALISAKDPNRIKDPEDAAMRLILSVKESIGKYYGITLPESPEEALEMITKKMNILKKGGLPDTKAGAKRILFDWQKGKIHI